MEPFIPIQPRLHDVPGPQLSIDYGILLLGVYTLRQRAIGDSSNEEFDPFVRHTCAFGRDDRSFSGGSRSAVNWTDMNYNAHLRGRVGARFGDADVFVAAGLAVAEFEQEVDENKDTHTLVGLSLGAGVDWLFTDRLRARIEILHDDYGREDTLSNLAGQYSGDWTDTTLRGGLLFQF